MRTVMAAAVVLLTSFTTASAQSAQRCTEGRLADGRCVNPAQAQDLRTGSIVLSQPKLSMTNPPVLPSDDGRYDIPRDHHEIANLHGYPPVTSAFGNTLTFQNGSFAGPPTTTVNTGPRP